ncbi:MAG: hypothetical protein P8Z67_08790, partial [Gammaproteobacteria bacterium]
MNLLRTNLFLSTVPSLWILVLMVSVGPFGDTEYTPSLPRIAHELGVSYGAAQQSMTVYLLAYASVYSHTRRHLSELRTLFLTLGRADALLALASFATEHPRTSRPELTDEAARWQVAGAWHPLVADPVRTMEGVYAAFGDELTDQARSAMEAHVRARPKGHRGVHRYDLAEYGL